MSKLKVLFPFVEAGFGHIMTERTIADALEKKYGEYLDIVRVDFFKQGDKDTLKKFENRMCEEVRKFNRNIVYGYLSTIAMTMAGPTLASFAVMRLVGGHAYKDGVSEMEKLSPDVVVSTHWATNYYANKISRKPYTITYVPDAHANALFRYKCDYELIGMEEGYKRARRHFIRFNKDNLSLTSKAIREQAFSIDRDKKKLREKLNHDDKFTVFIMEGGYGIGLMEEICKRVIDEDLNVSLIAVCGKNPELYDRLKKLKSKGNTSFYPYGFADNVLELIASSDIYFGKSGNGLMEPAFFGVPTVVTHSANDIEKLLARHYVKYKKSAIRIFNAQKCVEFIKSAISGDEKFEELKHPNISDKEFGGEYIADLIFQKLNEKYHLC